MGYYEVWIDEPEYTIREHWDSLTSYEQQVFLDFLWSQGAIRMSEFMDSIPVLELITELRKKGYTVEPA